MKQFTFHLLTLSHLPQHKKFMSCAFTQKNRKLAKMLTSLGHKVYAYCSEGSDIKEYCNSDNLIQVEVIQLADIWKDYGDGWNLDKYPSVKYDFYNTDFRHDFNSERKPSTIKFYKNCVLEIIKRKKDDDFLLMTQGFYQRPIADSVKLYLTCEPGVGYRGSISSEDYGGFHPRAFESSYIQNFTYGSEHPRECSDGSYYDRVIPNYFDPDDIKFSTTKEDYYLFIGRMIKRKGILTADLVSRHLNKKLIIVGQGAEVNKDGLLIPTTDPDFRLQPGTWDYIGYADIEKRKDLMSKAKLTFTPTDYLECFAGTHVESRLSGTPVLTTNFGVFPGTVENGLDGYRCDTLDDFVYSAKQIENWSKEQRQLVRKRAERYLMDYVKWEYQRWFEDVYQVYLSLDGKAKGWHNIRMVKPEWRNKIC